MVSNLLPFDGELYLYRSFYTIDQARHIFQQLLAQIDWRQERLFIYGRWLNVPRLMAWYGDEGTHYRYSGVDHEPLHWLALLSQIKQNVEKHCQQPFNSMMANLYRHGQDSMGCHADDEPELGQNPFIASLSFGETRLLRFRHGQSSQKLDIELKNGDLLGAVAVLKIPLEIQ
ncbi:alpha-ketoglutarate-dependent dioxygenase AlkB family protein [methane-oxidizing endosymbiont of Gigantopelta aegis]|uniref:alpha-ketoglutarate-dependent dioxygenase AlkB family protein n=1 Tax=methane-oxidizing endosymbiont of Gigantopelta aegis TaxID=2794938 RepID=UPI001FDABE8A|nr:alpha-ketoglutarate-dependent dioxygenase AlkB [methane-oxidizing endosymbiont of Gigantopelta aegis]